ncbi:MAG: helix-turn-helix domain-containing protein [Myxococcales bacterium]|nr:helix-turn-helix domain-containing protein [Myxococcales bacterium]
MPSETPQPALISTLRARRSAAGLSQGELAAQVGVSRQALIAIELGRQVPSTALALQLARALRCGVESLFALPGGPVLTARWAGAEGRVAERAVVGRVDGRWVAHASACAERSADALLLALPDARGQVSIESLCEPKRLEQNLLVAGCAPLLGVLADRLAQRHRDARASWIAANSTRALELLAAGLVHVAGIHLGAASDAAAHASIVRQAVGARRVTLVNLARWRQGLLVAPGNPLGLAAGCGAFGPELRWALREPGSGARQLLERVLRQDGLQQVALAAGPPVARDHAEVARLVRWGLADAGVAIEAVARAEGLDFIPLAEERFDLVVPDALLETPLVSRWLDTIGRPAFRAEASRLPGYDLSLAGQASSVGV